MQRDTFGCVFSPDDVKAAVTSRDVGYDTVSLTYTLHVLTTKLPGLATQKEKIAEISTLRAKLKEKGFSIPAPIDEVDGHGGQDALLCVSWGAVHVQMSHVA